MRVASKQSQKVYTLMAWVCNFVQCELTISLTPHADTRMHACMHNLLKLLHFILKRLWLKQLVKMSFQYIKVQLVLCSWLRLTPIIYTYFLVFFISSKLYCHVRYNPYNVGSVSFEISPDPFLSPYCSERRSDALELPILFNGFSLHLEREGGNGETKYACTWSGCG